MKKPFFVVAGLGLLLASTGVALAYMLNNSIWGTQDSETLYGTSGNDLIYTKHGETRSTLARATTASTPAPCPMRTAIRMAQTWSTMVPASTTLMPTLATYWQMTAYHRRSPLRQGY